MAYQQSLDYLYGLQQFGIKLGLDNITRLLERLGHPERTYATVHLAGTNGKGSTAAALAEILTRSGYSCGLYTSPHLSSFTERVQIDRQPISEQRVVELTDEIRDVGRGLPLTFFEFTTAMALLQFSRCKVDVAVIETGMGGRLDATNCLSPALTVITPIGIDHCDYLGDNLAAIATEKAGIIKAGVPVVVGRQQPESLAVIVQSAHQLNSPVVRFDADYRVIDHATSFTYESDQSRYADLCPRMEGLHQRENLALALAATDCLQHQGWSLDPVQVRAAVEAVQWPGRLEWIDDHYLLDGAHNAQGAQALACYLQRLERSVHWICGIKSDKDLPALIAAIGPFCAHVYAVPPGSMEGVPVDDILSEVRRRGGQATGYGNSESALQAADAACKASDVVLVAGSLYLVGDLRSQLLLESVRDHH